MTDPRKKILRPDEATQDAVRDMVYAHLLETTERGSRAVGCTGASFVVMGMSMWATELAELDGRATSQLLRALSDLFDPTSNDTKKRAAEKKRRAAVDRLFAALDLEMAEPGGRA